jgi:hypothetical protein
VTWTLLVLVMVAGAPITGVKLYPNQDACLEAERTIQAAMQVRPDIHVAMICKPTTEIGIGKSL